MSENRIWYVNVNRQTYGPYSNEEIISMLRTETVKYSDYIFREGFKNWDFLYNVPEFDRRILNPGGDQPLVHAPKEATPEEVVPQQKAEEEGKPIDELWYIHDGEHQTGPYAATYIKEALDNKTVFWTYYVWKEGFDNWVQIKDCKEFDRRKTPRGQAPVKVDISTDYDEIKKEAVSSLPKKEDAPQIYGGVDQPANVQYGISDLDQEELRGKYPVKGVLALLVIVTVLFGVVRAYPWFSERSREKRAINMYESGVDLIEKQSKYQDGFQKLFDLMDMYPNSTAERKNENYIRSKEPMVKGQLADEARKIKELIESFDKKYGVLPANSIDLGYVPSFWLKYFGEAYFRRSGIKKVEVLVKGIKFPVEMYTFSTDTDNKETEQEIKQEDFVSKSRLYTKLSYAGRKSLVKPIELPKLLNTTVLSPEKQKEAKEQAAAIAKKEQAQKRQEATRKSPTTKKKILQDERIPGEDDQDNLDEEQQTEIQTPDEEYGQEETTIDDETQGPVEDEYGETINKIKKEK